MVNKTCVLIIFMTVSLLIHRDVSVSALENGNYNRSEKYIMIKQNKKCLN